ncbi:MULTISPECIES: H(+)/Cl(-) exchange transporter ClcA [unclassified Xanthobacter]|uniref:H(+)/Cl(-) exchange transporter ClcA n=1 Tax=unclassified Xanthobacter TaxID=2623496 RepID=UPI001EDE7971|nr:MULTISPECIES: H(+)/Cl(-) exchange transporter ClcA [unclassified Xanthobacter]
MNEDLLAQGQPGDRPGEARYVVLAVLTGALAGFVGSIFHLLIDQAVLWPGLLRHYVDGWWLVAAAAAISMVCAVVAVFIVRHVAPEAGGSGVQEIEGAMEGLREVRWRRVLPVKFFAGLIAIGSGLVLGREGPTIHMGASAAAAVAEASRTSELERRGLLAAGAAAGLACAFNAPVAAVLFVIEETHKEFPYTFRTYLGVIFASAASTLVTQLIGGTGPDLPLPVVGASLQLLPAFLLLGVVLGVIGVALNGAIMAMVNFNGRSFPHAPYVYPAAIGLAVGALFILAPKSVTGGESIILELARENMAVTGLLVLGLIRFFTMVGSYSSGVPGGIFAPILTLAACVGFAFGGALEQILPDAGISALPFAIVAMGGLFTASVRAPIVGVALTLELTGSYALALPLMVTCVTADLMAQWCGGRPIYSQLLERTLAQAGIKSSPKGRAPTGLA